MIRIVPFQRELQDGVRQFNARLRAGNVATQFSENHQPSWLPRAKNPDLFQERFLAVDEQAHVRGGFMIKHQSFDLNGATAPIANFQIPLSEGIVDQNYSFVGLKLLTTALRKHPQLFVLGMGGYQEPLPRLLQAARWTVEPVPFWFRVVRPNRFLHNIVALRTSRLRRVVLDGLAMSGLGWTGVRVAQLWSRPRPLPPVVSHQEVDHFSESTDNIWQSCRTHYSLIAARDCKSLNTLYPRRNRAFIRLEVRRNQELIGWAVLLVTQMSGHRQFGNMVVGSLVDCLSSPDDANDVVTCARIVLQQRGADLMVSNQSHAAWCRALKNSGFLSGPTNFLLALSPKLAAQVQPVRERLGEFHFNRGDGDGPINL